MTQSTPPLICVLTQHAIALHAIANAIEGYSRAQDLGWDLVRCPLQIPSVWTQRVQVASARKILIGYKPVTSEEYNLPGHIAPGAPAICLNQVAPLKCGQWTHWVCPDLAAIGRTAAEHLVSSGARSFCTWGVNTDQSAIQPRFDAFAAALIEQERQVVHFPSEMLDTQRIACLHAMPQPIGIFCHQDRVAQWLINHLLALGMKLGREILVIGCDDVPDNDSQPVPLSSVRLPMQLMGLVAARIAHRLLAGPWPVPRQSLQVVKIAPIGVAARASTQIIADDPDLRRAMKVLETSSRPPRTVLAWAKTAKVPPRRLSALVKHRFGCTAQRWLSKQLAQKAKTLLAQTDLPIAAVALQTGFANDKHFITDFRTRFGESPGRFRRMLRDPDWIMSGSKPTNVRIET